MDATQLIADLADKARLAARTLVAASSSDRKEALLRIADEIEASEVEILAANALDMERAEKDGMQSSMKDRLLLTAPRIHGIADGARQVAALPDPLGKVLRESTLANGLHLKQMSVPFGVIGMVYEARPNVTVDAAVILVASGNAALLRGSSTSTR